MSTLGPRRVRVRLVSSGARLGCKSRPEGFGQRQGLGLSPGSAYRMSPSLSPCPSLLSWRAVAERRWGDMSSDSDEVLNRNYDHELYAGYR
jgi:hypothetical protein